MARSTTLKSPWRSAEDRAAEREEKRIAVLHAAAAAFAENGYHGTSLDGIAARLGVTKPTIYYYARNKDELVSAVAERALHQIIDATEGDETAPALTQLQHLIRRYAETMTTDDGKCLAMMHAAGVSGPVAERLRERFAQVDCRIRELLAQGKVDGSIAPCDAKMTAFMIAGAINGISQWFDPQGSQTARIVAEKFTNQLTAGLAPRS